MKHSNYDDYNEINTSRLIQDNYDQYSKNSIYEMKKTDNFENIHRSPQINTNYNSNTNNFENELNKCKLIILKLKEELHSKELLVKEYQTLIELAAEKFEKIEKNEFGIEKQKKNLLNEITKKDIELNESRKLIEDYKSNIEEMKNSKKEFENLISELKRDFLKKQTNLKNKIKEMEKDFNEKFSEREEIIKQEYINNIISLTKELDKTKIELENTKLSFEKYKRMNNFDKEFSLSNIKNKSFYSLQMTNEFQNRDELKTSETLNKDSNNNQILQTHCNKLEEQLNFKEKQLRDIENDFLKLNLENEKLKAYCLDLESALKLKEQTVQQLKNNNEEILNFLESFELNKKENDSDIVHQLKFELKEKDKEIEVLQKRNFDLNNYINKSMNKDSKNFI